MARTITLINNVGGLLPLTWPYLVGDAPALWGSPPVQYREDEWPGVAGSVLTEIRHGAREAILPIGIAADSTTEADEALSALLRAINAVEGPIRLRVTRDDGTERELTCYVVGGFENLAYTKANSSMLAVPLRLYAPHPYWRSTTGNETPFIPPSLATGQGSTRYADDLPYGASLPYTGVTSAGHLSANLGVSGDVMAWPRFQVTGPASSIELVNHHPASHQAMFFDNVLAEGQTLVIETEPGKRMVSVDGSPAFTSMGDGWEWWGLHPGDNEIGLRVESTGATTGLEISFHEEYLTA